jgi:hypothetical protein
MQDRFAAWRNRSRWGERRRSGCDWRDLPDPPHQLVECVVERLFHEIYSLDTSKLELEAVG